jgi:hypothetical protein
MRAGALAAIAGSCMRWMLPWAWALIVSGALAYAADQALGHRLVEQPASALSLTEAVFRPPGGVGLRWVVLMSTDEQGGAQSSITCLAPADRVSDDALQLAEEDLDSVARGVCLWAAIERWTET